MAKMNKINMIGNVTADATVRAGEKNKLVTFNIAVNLPAKDETKSHFYKVETWVSNESKLEETLKKGTCVVVNGKLLERTFPPKDGTTGQEAYIQATRVNAVKDGWASNNADFTGHVFVAMPPAARGKTTAVRVGVEGLYNKEKKTTDVMFLDVIYFGEIAEKVLEHVHKGDSMNVSGTLVTNDRTTKDGKSYKVCQILTREYPDITRRGKGGEAEDSAPVMDAPTIDEDDEAIPF